MSLLSTNKLTRPVHMLTFYIERENYTVNKTLQKHGSTVTWQRLKTDANISGMKNGRML